MKFLSFNYKGLANPGKKSSFKRLVDSTRLDIILLQETLGTWDCIKLALEALCPSWSFEALAARGRSGGLTIGWRCRVCRAVHVWGFDSGMGLYFFSEVMGQSYTILNIYGPYHNRDPFWESLLNKSFLKGKEVILGGDLNLYFGATEVWGPRAIPDPLGDFFIRSFVRSGLVDIAPQNLMTTWRNKRAGEHRVVK